MRREDTRPTTLFEAGERSGQRPGERSGEQRPGESRGRAAHTAAGSIEPGKDHYVRSSGKLIAVLLARLYPTEWDLEQARRDYERGVGAPVELSCRRFGRRSETESAGE